MYLNSFLVIAICILSSCDQSTANSERHPNTEVKDSCAHPDAPLQCSFLGMPSSISSIIKIAADNEPSERMIITGHIYKADGRTPMSDVIMYLYHTDNKGDYSKAGNEKGVQTFHGRLHAWGKTDADGYYEIHSIRPAQYPEHTIPAHIHAILKQPDGKMYWINDFVFADDKLVTDKYIRSLNWPTDNGIVDLRKDGDTWKGVREIIIK